MAPRRLALPVLAALVALAALAPPAGAARNLGRVLLTSDDQFAIDRGTVIYTRIGSGGRREVVEATPSRTRVIARLPGPGGGDRFFQYEEFAASAERWIYGNALAELGEIDAEDLGGRIVTGAEGDENETLLDCPSDPNVVRLAASGSAVAYQPASCPQGTALGSGIVVRDLAPAAPVPTRTVPAAFTGRVELAGRYLAYGVNFDEQHPPASPERQIVVHDWVAGGEAYRVSGSDTAPLHGSAFTHHFDLQADGQLVSATGTQPPTAWGLPCRDNVGMATYQQSTPTAFVLPLEACQPEVRMSGGAIAFARRFGTRGIELATTDPSGVAATTVARFAHAGMLRGFDYDGTTLVFTRTDCLDRVMYTEGEAPAKPPTFGVPNCPIRILSSAGRVTRGGSARVRVSCPRGCDMSIETTTYTGEKVRVVRLRPGVPRTFGFRLPDRILDSLRAGRRQRIRIVARHNEDLPVRTRHYRRNVTILPR
ncbi:MAG: hypothetical protein M3340_05455 [Actinomycetota bacterium]|nr:hypothetical protein [Actinomycetota bacterium]